MKEERETSLTDFLINLLQVKVHNFENKVNNRINNLIDTLAYKHELKAVEDKVFLLRTRVEAVDFIQKDNDKIHKETRDGLKKKTDFSDHLKNRSWLKSHDKELQRLEAKINSFVMRKDIDLINEFNDKQAQKLDNLSKEVHLEYCKTGTMTEKVANLDKFLRNNYLTKTVVHNRFTKTETAQTKTNFEIVKVKENADKIHRNLKDLSNITARKADITKILKDMEDLCHYSDFDALRGNVLPALKGFGETVKTLENDVKTYSQIMNRFDEVICSKASKISLSNLENDMQNYVHGEKYKRDQDFSQDVFNRIYEKIDDCYKFISKTAQTSEDNINTLFNKGMDEMKKEFMSYHSPENLVDYGTFNSALDTKVEKSDLDKLLEGKSDINQMDTNTIALQVLHKQLKNIGILVFEILRKEFMKFEESKKIKNCAKREAKEILEQASNITKWINCFNPQNVNKEDFIIPNETKDIQFINFIDFKPKMRLRNKLRGSGLGFERSSRTTMAKEFRHKNRSVSPDTMKI
ncbi:unnamed protein product [Moneuplotes crassus]|uniref:Uncharacterized protein n=1 Tax=Euplotes crassus TaxID=5936 RepID=A0AAD1X620_EUPCR|nr:unnamed protein product [Moneuplotes crassus]